MSCRRRRGVVNNLDLLPLLAGVQGAERELSVGGQEESHGQEVGLQSRSLQPGAGSDIRELQLVVDGAHDEHSSASAMQIRACGAVNGSEWERVVLLASLWLSSCGGGCRGSWGLGRRWCFHCFGADGRLEEAMEDTT